MSNTLTIKTLLVVSFLTALITAAPAKADPTLPYASGSFSADSITEGGFEELGLFAESPDSIAVQNATSASGLWNFSLGAAEISITGDNWTIDEGPSTVAFNSPFVGPSEKTIPATSFSGILGPYSIEDQTYVLHDGDPDDALGDASFYRWAEGTQFEESDGLEVFLIVYGLDVEGVSMPEKTATWLYFVMGAFLILGGTILQRELRI